MKYRIGFWIVCLFVSFTALSGEKNQKKICQNSQYFLQHPEMSISFPPTLEPCGDYFALGFSGGFTGFTDYYDSEGRLAGHWAWSDAKSDANQNCKVGKIDCRAVNEQCKPVDACQGMALDCASVKKTQRDLCYAINARRLSRSTLCQKISRQDMKTRCLQVVKSTTAVVPKPAEH